jgi:hypothetical protein
MHGVGLRVSGMHGVGSQVHGVHSKGSDSNWGSSEQGCGMLSSWQATALNFEFHDSLNACRIN